MNNVDKTHDFNNRLFEDKTIKILVITSLFVFGLFLRLFSALLTETPWRDITDYVESAKVIKSFNFSEYPAPREPGYPILLAIVYLLFPDSIMTARVTTSIIGATWIPLTFLTAESLRTRLIQEGKTTSILVSYVSSFFIAINPFTILTDGRGLREPLSGLILLSLLYFVFKVQREPTGKNYGAITILAIALFSVKFEMFFASIFLIFFVFFYHFSHYGFKNKEWKKLFIILIVLSVIFILENLLIYMRFGYTTSSYRAKKYFEAEFNEKSSPLSLIQYVLSYHTLSEIFQYTAQGISESLGLHIILFGSLGFSLIVVGVVYLLKKNVFEIPGPIFLAIASQAFFIHTYGWKRDMWRLFLPNVPLLSICIGYAIILSISDLKIQITPEKTITISKKIILSMILVLFALIYLIKAFWEIFLLIP